ncbi:2-phospho-L-lactate guanylyltransferase [Rhodococcus maanshanensis]|uniref:Phosphoenolpyruvate guanylyltransferase n=1 Tax=Rhodococcus maanshanensis TaxID=183556 RepID=A0A1H7FF16_9NOCA|nr:2-phospho-L-lactate guanylyltransferase [Rhodococcus maanshanensis]SEK24559.1 2-phospho-L-lactate guanylyltransferase [Rhodococcus maanshanensis]
MDQAHHTPPAGQAHVLIAVKELGRAKSRLAARLGPQERTALVLAMLRDTLTAAATATGIAEITVITPDPSVARVARECGAGHYADPAGEGEDRLNAVLRAAAAHLRSTHGRGPIVALQGDLPCLRPDELSEALAAGTGTPRSFVVDHHGTGTAALIVGDPEADLDPGFGPDSARRHRLSGAAELTGDWPGLRLDVDTAADLDAAVMLGPGRSTAAELDRIGWPGVVGTARRVRRI